MGGKARITVTYDRNEDADIASFIENRAEYGIPDIAELGRRAIRNLKSDLEASKKGTSRGWHTSGLIDLLTPRNIDFSEIIQTSQRLIICLKDWATFLATHNHESRLNERLKKGHWTRLYINYQKAFDWRDQSLGKLEFHGGWSRRTLDTALFMTSLGLHPHFLDNDWKRDEWPFKVIGLSTSLAPSTPLTHISYIATADHAWINVDGNFGAPYFEDYVFQFEKGLNPQNIYHQMLETLGSAEVDPELGRLNAIQWWFDNWELYYSKDGALLPPRLAVESYPGDDGKNPFSDEPER